MYKVIPQKIETLKELEKNGVVKTVFQTTEWINFITVNQNGIPVLLKIIDERDDTKAYFVGLIVKKAGIKILGSPFEGWLTCDMGFIRISEFDINKALKSVAKYAFKALNCFFVQVTDYQMKFDELDPKIRRYSTKILHIDNSKPLENIIEGFSKNGRRDVRASQRKGVVIKKVPFDKHFADIYYDQLKDVFAKQNTKPFYSLEKIYDLVDAFKDKQDRVLAMEAFAPDAHCIATVFSFGFGEWAYYIGAASYREYQKYLPNEALFYAFVEHWNENKIKNIDLVGYREYKMKYSPTIIEVPTVYFERIPGLFFAKKTMKKIISFLRR